MDAIKALESLEQFVNSRVLSLFDASSDSRVFQFAREIQEEIRSIKEQLQN